MSISADNGGLSADWSPSIQWSPTVPEPHPSLILHWLPPTQYAWVVPSQYKRAYKTYNSSPRGDPLIDRRPYRHNTTHYSRHCRFDYTSPNFTLWPFRLTAILFYPDNVRSWQEPFYSTTLFPDPAISNFIKAKYKCILRLLRESWFFAFFAKIPSQTKRSYFFRKETYHL